MNCPQCGQELPNVPGYLYICPFCHGILTDRLKQKAKPLVDKQNQLVEIYPPNKEVMEYRGALQAYSIQEEELKRKKKQKEKQTINWVLAILCFGAIVSGVLADLSTLAILALYAFINITLGALTNKDKDEEYTVIYKAEAEGNVPIVFYGNDNTFGYASIPAACNAYNDFPPITFNEISKARVINVEFQQEYWAVIEYHDNNLRLRRLRIDPFCTQEELRYYLGLDPKPAHLQ